LNDAAPQKYPLLEPLLASRGMALQPMYTNQDVAKIFGTVVRTIQSWIAAGRLTSRDLPGRWRFLSQDLEDFIRNSRRPRRLRGSDSLGMAA